VNFIRFMLHAGMMIALATSSAMTRGHAFEACTNPATTKVRHACCQGDCSCVKRSQTQSVPVPAMPSSETRVQVDPMPLATFERRINMTHEAAIAVQPAKAFQRAREASRVAALPLHVQVCVFLI